MALIATLLLVAIAVADFRAARALARHPRRAFALALAALVFLLSYLYFTLWRHVVPDVPWDDFVYFERLPAHAAILLIVALCWYLPGRISRVTIITLIVLGGGYAFLEVGGPLLLPVYSGSLSNQVEKPPSGEIEVIQSTGWSCGPAALAWALQSAGHPATERQLAVLAASTPFQGTSDSGMLRACHKLGLPATMLRLLTVKDLQALPKPCLVTWHLSGLVMHWIVVLAAGPDKIQVGDPMMGPVDYTEAEFQRKWMRDALVLK